MAMVSPGITGMSGTGAPSTVVNVSWPVASIAMTRGLSGVPGSMGAAEAAAGAAAPPIWPLGLRQQSGGGVASGAGVQFGSRQPRTVVGPSAAAVGAAAPWVDGWYSNVTSWLAVIQATSSSTWR